jgi:ACS family tartrate transporter-like MFS transporter
VGGAVFAQAAAFLVLAMGPPPWVVVGAMTVAVSGRWSFIGPFWGLPTSLLTGTAAAGGIALINSIGNLGGQAGPLLMSGLSSPSGGLAPGLVALAVVAAACGVLALAVPIRQAAGGRPAPSVPSERWRP